MIAGCCTPVFFLNGFFLSYNIDLRYYRLDGLGLRSAARLALAAFSADAE